MPKLLGFFDGTPAREGYTGGYGIVLYREWSRGRDILLKKSGPTSPDADSIESEIVALIQLLKEARKYTGHKDLFLVFGDNDVVLRWVNGAARWSPGYQKLVKQAMSLMSAMSKTCSVFGTSWVPRTENKIADALAEEGRQKLSEGEYIPHAR